MRVYYVSVYAIGSKKNFKFIIFYVIKTEKNIKEKIKIKIKKRQ